VSAGYVICAACGARIKAGRIRCLRCGEELRAREPEAASQPVEERRGGSSGTLLVLGVGGTLAVIGLVAIVSQARTEPTPLTVSRAAQSQPSAPLHGAAQRPSSGIATFEPTTVLDSRRAGTASFATGDFEAARASYQKAVDKNPNDPEALNGLGQSLVRLGRLEEAVAAFERAVASSPDTWTYRFNLARAFGLLGQWDRAIDGYREAIRLFPDDYATQYNLAMALHKKGDERGAVAAFQKAIDLAPSEPTFHISLGVSLEKLGRVADAVREYRVFLEMDPDSPDAPKLKSHIDALTAPQTTPAKPS
jgi:Flp pilus assembly protein TadD